MDKNKIVSPIVDDKVSDPKLFSYTTEGNHRNSFEPQTVENDVDPYSLAQDMNSQITVNKNTLDSYGGYQNAVGTNQPHNMHISYSKPDYDNENIYDRNFTFGNPQEQSNNPYDYYEKFQNQNANDVDPLLKKKKIGNYHLIRSLGNGTFGEVFQACHVNNHRDYYLIKCIKKSEIDSNNLTGILKTEMKLMIC